MGGVRMGVANETGMTDIIVEEVIEQYGYCQHEHCVFTIPQVLGNGLCTYCWDKTKETNLSRYVGREVTSPRRRTSKQKYYDKMKQEKLEGGI